MKKIYIKILICIFLFLFIGMINYIHEKRNNSYLSNQDCRYYNAELASTENYDSVFLGTSLSENFMPSEFDKLFGANSIKLTFYGGKFKENYFLMRYVTSRKKLSFIIVEITEMSFAEPKYYFPENLYHKNPMYRIANRFSRYFSLQKCLTTIHEMMHKSIHITRDDIYAWKNNQKCSEISFARNAFINTPHSFDHLKEIDNNRISEINKKMDEYLLPFLEMTKNCTVFAFFPPMHIMSYGEDKETILAIKKMQSNALLKYPNVRVYDFGVADNIIHNANLYRDLMHYNADVNSWMLKMMHENQYRMTLENQDDFLKKLDEMVIAFDWNGEYKRLQNLLTIKANKTK